MARAKVPRAIFDYIAGGAEDEVTLRRNREAFGRWALRPRVLRDVSKRDTKTVLLGERVSMPVCVAPTSFHALVHPEGEVATARGTAAAETILIASTVSTKPLEEIAAAADAPRWFQLYVYKDRAVTEELVNRAVKAGYKALCLTADTPVLGRRERDERNAFTLPPGFGIANLKPAGLDGMPEVEQGSAFAQYVTDLLDSSLTWDDVDWLKSISPLPLVVKGIMTAEDAVLAVDHGIAGIVVSNHGGRQLDSTLGSLDALPEVVAAVRGRIEVYLDGGIRRGTDVLKALALGAKAVFVGRPVLWGLALGGADGVRAVLDELRTELDTANGACGLRDTEGYRVKPGPTGGLGIRHSFKEVDQESDRPIVAGRLRRKTPEGELLGNQLLQTVDVTVLVAEGRGISFGFGVALRRNRNHRGPGGERFVHRSFARGRDDEVRRQDVVLEVRQESVRVHTGFRVHFQLRAAHDDHRDIFQFQRMECANHLANQEFTDRGASDGDEDRLLPEHKILSEFLARRTEPSDDGPDATDVRPVWRGVCGEDELGLSRNARGPEVRGAFDETGQRIPGKVVAGGIEDQGRRNPMSDRLARGSQLAVGKQEAVIAPVGLPVQESSGHPEGLTVVPVTPPHWGKDPIRRLPIGRRWHREHIEAVRHDEIQRRRPGEEEQIQIPPAFEEAASEGHGASRMAETLGVNREVSAEFLHRATHCPLPQRPSDETSEMPRNQPIL